MSEKNSSARNHRQLSISVPPASVSTATEKPAGPDATAKENGAKHESSWPPDVATDEKLAKHRVHSGLPGILSVVTTPGSVSTPNSGPASALPGNEQPNAGPSVINKQLLSKLNKTLKEKQKVIQNKESHTKNPTLIQDILTTLPLVAAFPHNSTSSNITQGAEPGRSILPSLEANNDDHAHEAETGPAAAIAKEPEVKKNKIKRIAKQNSTRTDFFAAKLASAVDDVSSSNSDETFVYENNVNDFDDETNLGLQSGMTGGVPNSGMVNGGDESVGLTNNVDNINQVPPSIHLVNDNISVAGSLRNATPLELSINSPTTEPKRELEEPTKTDQHRAESIHSLQLSKWNLRNTLNANTTPPSVSNARLHHPSTLAHGESSSQFLNPYFDNLMRDASNKAARRKSSLQSLISEDKSYLQRLPVLHYSDPNHTTHHNSYGAGVHLLSTNRNETYNEANFSYDEGEGETLSAELDAASSQADENLIYTDTHLHNTITSPTDGMLKPDSALVTGKHDLKKTRASTTLSKLRSTTSKLFDKKGAQPRRYSTIPDDIDIEDFDDELIYYDNNNIRFPYNSQNGNESSSLLGGSHRLPHYRSLNLNFNNKRQASNGRNKRYTSLGYVPASQPMAQNGNKNNDIFPFPYSESNQKYYYDFDEYDEEAGEHVPVKGIPMGRNQLSPNNTHFFLPRKVSHDNLEDSKVRCFKSFIYTLISITCILAIGFVLGFLLASTKDLNNLSIVSIDNALVSQDELVFSIVVEALNPGWFTVAIEDVEIDIFAKSGYLGAPGELSVETVLLGSVSSFESPLVFEGSFFNREVIQQRGDIKLVGPGKNLTGSNDPMQLVMGYKLKTYDKPDPHGPDNSEKWAIISKHPFDLILRGVLKYNLPMTSTVKAAVVNKIGYVDPSSPGLST